MSDTLPTLEELHRAGIVNSLVLIEDELRSLPSREARLLAEKARYERMLEELGMVCEGEQA